MQRAHGIALNNGRDPNALGFTVDDTGSVGLVPQDGRFARATAPNERGQLETNNVRGWNGQTVPHSGPVDLVGWLRLNGGLKNQGDELSHMGLHNRGRAGMDFTGQEHRFGPLVNPKDGMNLDDAAFKAWEAGYFPGHERPDTNAFLDAVRGTHEGWDRRFLPEDMGQIDNFGAAQADRFNLQQSRFEGNGKVWKDNSVPADGPQPMPPPEAYGQKEVATPTIETLDLVKKGFDSRLNEARDAFGNLDLQGNPQLQAIEGLRQRFLGKLDTIAPDYPRARAEYQKFAQRKDALEQGLALTRNALPQRTFDSALGKATAYDGNFRQSGDMLLPEMRRGYATGMADKVGQVRLSSNPYEAIYGSPNQQQRVGALFPEGAQNFDRQYGLERDMAKTRQETIGGSPTAARQQADTSFLNDMGSTAVDAATSMATGGGIEPMRAIKALAPTIKDKLQYGMTRKRAEGKANDLAGILFNTDPQSVLNYVNELSARQLQQSAREQTFRRNYGLFGATAAPALFGPK